MALFKCKTCDGDKFQEFKTTSPFRHVRCMKCGALWLVTRDGQPEPAKV